VSARCPAEEVSAYIVADYYDKRARKRHGGHPLGRDVEIIACSLAGHKIPIAVTDEPLPCPLCGSTEVVMVENRAGRSYFLMPHDRGDR